MKGNYHMTSRILLNLIISVETPKTHQGVLFAEILETHGDPQGRIEVSRSSPTLNTMA